MGCGNFVSVFSEDPQDMPGQGLARTDNYKDVAMQQQYSGLLKAYTGNQGAVLEAEQKYKPQYIAQDLANTDQALQGNLALLQQYLPQIAAVRAGNDPQADALRQLLLAQATSEVQAGSGLTPAQQRAAQQASRAGMAARGMSGGNQALADELLAQFDLGEQLKGNRQNFALRMLGTNQQLQQGQTPQDWLNFATGTGRTAAPTVTPVGAQVGWLNSVYGQNQENNRAQAALETKIGMDEADKWNDGLMMGLGSMTGGGGAGAGG
jgi:hypothetical protein